MSKGKHKIAAEKRRQVLEEVGSLEALRNQVKELTEENEALKKQADQDHAHHAFQIAQMFQDIQDKSSSKLREVEADNTNLRAQLLKLKRSLRGEE